MVNASGVDLRPPFPFDNEIDSGDDEVGVIGVVDTVELFVSRTVAAVVTLCAELVAGLNVIVLPFVSVELRLTATFVPRFSNSINVASLVSMVFGTPLPCDDPDATMVA